LLAVIILGAVWLNMILVSIILILRNWVRHFFI
jgi:hypothetical protein